MDSHNPVLHNQSIERIKKITEEVLALNDLEEKILMQRSKIDWLKKGYGNNSYFYASIKAKHHTNNLKDLTKNDGTIIHNQQDIGREILAFYSNLMGKVDNNLTHVDVEAMRMGSQLTRGQREILISNVTDT